MSVLPTEAWRGLYSSPTQRCSCSWIGNDPIVRPLPRRQLHVPRVNPPVSARTGVSLLHRQRRPHATLFQTARRIVDNGDPRATINANLNLLTVVSPINFPRRLSAGTATNRQGAIALGIEANNHARAVAGIELIIPTDNDRYVDAPLRLWARPAVAWFTKNAPARIRTIALIFISVPKAGLSIRHDPMLRQYGMETGGDVWGIARLCVNRRAKLTPDRRPILTPS